MTLDQKISLVQSSHMFIAIGLPVLFFWALRGSTTLTTLSSRWFLTVFFCWFARLAHRWFFELPLYFNRARIEGDEAYDGVGGNAVLLLLGWLEPAVISTLICIGITVRRRLKQRELNTAA